MWGEPWACMATAANRGPCKLIWSILKLVNCAYDQSFRHLDLKTWRFLGHINNRKLPLCSCTWDKYLPPFAIHVCHGHTTSYNIITCTESIHVHVGCQATQSEDFSITHTCTIVHVRHQGMTLWFPRKRGRGPEVCNKQTWWEGSPHQTYMYTCTPVCKYDIA